MMRSLVVVALLTSPAVAGKPSGNQALAVAKAWFASMRAHTIDGAFAITGVPFAHQWMCNGNATDEAAVRAALACFAKHPFMSSKTFEVSFERVSSDQAQKIDDHLAVTWNLVRDHELIVAHVFDGTHFGANHIAVGEAVDIVLAISSTGRVDALVSGPEMTVD